MKCGVCGFTTDQLIWAEDGWRRCRFCGSDTNHGRRRHGEYSIDYAENAVQNDGKQKLREQLTTNVELIRKLRGERKTAIDVGCNEGTLVEMLQEDGWEAVGFDIYPGIASLVADEYDAIYGAYDLVICREVIEHVAEPERLLRELIASLAPGGLLHIQTPRPIERYSAIVYQSYHDHILSPMALGGLAAGRGLREVDRLIWDCGQCWTWVNSAG